MKNKKLWTFCKIAVGIIVIFTFTPIVIPQGVYKPTLGGMPYTLWVGILDAMLILGITWLATRAHSGIDN